MKIEKNTEAIQAGKTYFLELVSVDGGAVFSMPSGGKLKIPCQHVRALYAVVSTHPAFDRCKDCAHAHPDGPRNVTCQYNPSVCWSKMSKACHHFTPTQQ